MHKETRDYLTLLVFRSRSFSSYEVAVTAKLQQHLYWGPALLGGRGSSSGDARRQSIFIGLER